MAKINELREKRAKIWEQAMPLGENAIIPRIYVKNLKGKELTDYLIDYGYIIPGQTKLYYDRFGKTFIIWIDENCKFWAGYYEGECPL